MQSVRKQNTVRPEGSPIIDYVIRLIQYSIKMANTFQQADHLAASINENVLQVILNRQCRRPIHSVFGNTSETLSPGHTVF